MSDKNKKIWTFLTGLVLGGALMYTGLHFCSHYDWAGSWMKPPKHGSKKLAERFNRELDLTPDQKIKVEAILESHMKKMKDMRDSMRPRFDEDREAVRTEVRVLLTPEQQVKFDKMNAEFEARRKKWQEKRDRGK